MINSSLSGILQDIIGLEHCEQAILVTRVGSMVAAAGSDSRPLAQSLGPIVAAVRGTGSEAGRLLGTGEAEYLLQRGRRHDLLLFPLPADMVLAATFPVGVEERHALAVADKLTEKLEALAPGSFALGPASLSPELRDEAASFIDQLFATAA